MVPADAEKPEQRARSQIDAMLVAAGWDVQDRAEMNLAAAPGVAVREFQTSAGPADYLLFLGNEIVGVAEAEKTGTTLSGAEAQTRGYADSAPIPLQVPIRPTPFLYESTGVETWFTNGLDPDPTARRVFSFHQPQTLRAWLDGELDRRAGKPGAPAAPTLKAAVESRLVPTEAALARAEGRHYEPATVMLDSVEQPPRPNRYKTRSTDVVPGHAALSIGDTQEELPKGWTRAPMVNVARMESGHTPSRNHPEGGTETCRGSVSPTRERTMVVLSTTPRNTRTLTGSRTRQPDSYRGARSASPARPPSGT